MLAESPAVVISVSMARMPPQISAHLIRKGACFETAVTVSIWFSHSLDEARLASGIARRFPGLSLVTSAATLVFDSHRRSQRRFPIGGTAYGRRSTESYADRKHWWPPRRRHSAR